MSENLIQQKFREQACIEKDGWLFYEDGSNSDISPDGLIFEARDALDRAAGRIQYFAERQRRFEEEAEHVRENALQRAESERMGDRYRSAEAIAHQAAEKVKELRESAQQARRLRQAEEKELERQLRYIERGKLTRHERSTFEKKSRSLNPALTREIKQRIHNGLIGSKPHHREQKNREIEHAKSSGEAVEKLRRT